MIDRGARARWNGPQKNQATILLDTQLTPIIRRLFVLGELQTSHNESNAVTIDNGMEMERLKQVKQLLILLRGALQNICNTINTNATDYSDENMSPRNEEGVQNKLVNQMNGIAVPLFNLLQPKDTASFSLVRRSAEYAVMEEAALTLATLWRCSRYVESIDFIRSLALPILVSCAMVLPCLEVGGDNSNFKSAAEIDDDGEEKKACCQMDGAVMDRGEDCALAILQLIQTILLDPTNSLDNKSKIDVWELVHDLSNKIPVRSDYAATLSKEVGKAVGGSLVARLVLSCLSLINQEDMLSGMNNQPKMSIALQLESLETLLTFMRCIEMPELWKSVLPGCFAGLYKSILTNLRYKSAASAHKVASASISVLSLLMRQTFAHPVAATTKSKDNSQSIMTSLLKVVDQAKQTSPTPLPQSSEQANTFKNEVNKRLPGPLSVLFSMIPANKSRLVRRSGLNLCRVILIDSWFIWQDNNAEVLGRKAFEYCLTLLGGDNDDVELQRCSRQLLSSYKSYIGIDSWRLRLSKSIVPTIIELLEMLPLFARSGRDLEVCTNLRLINGYLLVSFRDMDNEFDLKECIEKRRKSNISSALSCQGAISVMKKSFGVLFTPDVNTVTVQPIIEKGLSSEPNQIITLKENRSFRFLHLSDETIEMVKHTVHILACALGAKRSAFLVDSCFADVFQSCVKWVDKKVDDVLLDDISTRQLDWCGIIMFANEIFAGMCCRTNKTIANDKQSTGDYRVLSSLVSAVLPIAASHPLWTLPTVLPDEVSTGTLNRSISDKSHSTDTMRINSVLVCLLMGFVSRSAQCLEKDMRQNLSTILLPLLEKASAIGNHSSVQVCSFETISLVAVSSGYVDIFSLLRDNLDYIMDHISLKLRRHSKERSPASRSLMGVIAVVLRCIIRNDTVDQSHVPIIGHMLTCILNHFDRLNNPTMSQIQSLDTLCVFQSINIFMESSVEARTKSYLQHSSNKSEQHESLNNGLGVLELETKPTQQLEDDDESPSIRTSDDDESKLQTSAGNSSNRKRTNFAQEIAAINGVCKRCIYLICHPDLRMIILSIDTLLSGFRSLGKIGTYLRSIQGESASNPLLPAIAEYWPSISVRLKETSSKLHSKKFLSRAELSIRHMMAADQDKRPSDASLIVLLSKLLEMVSELCTISDGFFAHRYESDVYPILATILGDSIPVELNTSDKIKPQVASQKKNSAIDPVLQCIKLVYQSSCKDALASLIPSCGTILLPLLAHKAKLGDEVMGVLKVMLRVDHTSLQIPIQKLSGKQFTSNALDQCVGSKEIGDDCIVIKKPPFKSKQVCTIVMARRAQELLDFIDELPIQE